jgi:hypothetical protein
MIVPTWVAWLHDMNMMGPGARHAFAEKQLVGQPRLIFGDVDIAELNKRLDGA